MDNQTARVDNMAACRLFYVNSEQSAQIEALIALADAHRVAIDIEPILIEGRLNKKRRDELGNQNAPVLLLDAKNKLSLLSGSISAAPDWVKLQRRVVSAGRKSELLLRAAKVTADSQVIDATAGFGHDSLILASGGAQVEMIEQNPIMALLLLAEQARMSAEPNWQKLMARLTIINTDAVRFLSGDTKHPADVVYLDPMFPEDSFEDTKRGKGAKVGGLMQTLHHIAKPPTFEQEKRLLQAAIEAIAPQGRVIVKRPRHAPPLACRAADEQWQNDALRFDGYF